MAESPEQSHPSATHSVASTAGHAEAPLVGALSGVAAETVSSGPQAAAPREPAAALVGEAESGQKLLQFLQRRLQLPPALLHRWIRTGQIRLNGRRCKPFDRVATGNEVRLPPFALKMAAQSGHEPVPQAAGGIVEPDLARAALPPLPLLVGQEGPIWALDKPAGLPTHGGTGHEDSVAARLTAHYAEAAFKPTPAHRLDKDTSGVLLVGASFSALRLLQDTIRQGRMIKEYVVWVRGRWPWAENRLLRHHLQKRLERGFEKVGTAAPSATRAREALCLVRPLRVGEDQSLLLVRLVTGRTHQIRVQLASLGYPVVGDVKYGPPPRKAMAHGPMYLHALRIILPQGTVFTCLPQWQGAFALTDMPPCLQADGPDCEPDSQTDCEPDCGLDSDLDSEGL